MGGQFGIKETRELFDLGLALGKAAAGALDDGALKIEDLVLLVPAFSLVGPAFSNLDKVPKELSELDEEDAKSLMEYAKEKLPDVLEEDKLRLKVEKGLALALSLGEFLSALKA